MKKKAERPRKIKAVESVKYVIEDGILPINVIPIKHTPEYLIMGQMKVNQSVSYPPSKTNVFDYARNTYHKEGDKRFIIRTINKQLMRIFRVQDGVKLTTRKPKSKV